MDVIADLHVHSRHSRATGKELNLANLEKWGRIKGVNLLGTGDFTHPKWINEIKEELSEDDTGILKSKTGFSFMLQTEISFVYMQDSRFRKVHLLAYAPDIETAEKIASWLGSRGRLDYDGRPTFGMPCPEFVDALKSIDSKTEIIPAHIWTPWFSMLGASSGFDSVKECFHDTEKHIFALETGLSSDPPMNWRLSALDKYTLVSNSDLHSFWPWRLGREANVLSLKDLTYKSVFNCIKSREGFKETIEVNPSFGKYHWTGHRECGISISAFEAMKIKSMCKVCGKKLTVGVEQRVEELADREEGYVKKGAVPFRSLIPLSDIISAVIKKSVSSKAAWGYYNSLVKGRSEYDVLLSVSEEELIASSNGPIAAAIMQNRNGQIEVKPGFDGVYGEPMIGADGQKPKKKDQKGLKEFF
ncbi:DNA helicase UvrD [Candidatus Woesearchaeota archaeon]|nr:DNA helicase UvrD [Candidatus Woesearchaeota archaeon]